MYVQCIVIMLRGTCSNETTFNKRRPTELIRHIIKASYEKQNHTLQIPDCCFCQSNLNTCVRCDGFRLIQVETNVISDRNIQFKLLLLMNNPHEGLKYSVGLEFFEIFQTEVIDIRCSLPFGKERAIIFFAHCTPFERLNSVKVCGVTEVGVMSKSLNRFEMNGKHDINFV